jgi:hypothetical protein
MKKELILMTVRARLGQLPDDGFTRESVDATILDVLNAVFTDSADVEAALKGLMDTVNLPDSLRDALKKNDLNAAMAYLKSM